MLAILVALFVAQQFGAQTLGRFFGPVTLVWFSFIGVMGAMALSQNVAVLKALNPIYVYRFLVEYPGGFWLLGGVFLCTTGAEALYSDMGHCGRGNIAVILLTALFLAIEITFLVANLIKFEEGGWISMLLGSALITVMWLWFRGREYRRKLIVFESRRLISAHAGGHLSDFILGERRIASFIRVCPTRLTAGGG